MLLPEFLKNHKIAKQSCKTRHSEKKTYSGSDILIKYIKLPKHIEGQDVLVMSKHAAEAYESGEKSLSELDVTYDESHGYGIIMPTSYVEEESRW